MNRNDEALNYFYKMKKKTSSLEYPIKYQYLTALYKIKDFEKFRKEAFLCQMRSKEYFNSITKLMGISMIVDSSKLENSEVFLLNYDEDERESIDEFIQRKNESDFKSKTLAGVFSAIVPGSGKIYTNNIGDGITSLVLTGLFSYLAYENFAKDHPTRGWIFTGITAFFYAGNIYGSVLAAQNYNIGLRYNFENDIELFLKKKNYFTPQLDFICD